MVIGVKEHRSHAQLAGEMMIAEAICTCRCRWFESRVQSTNKPAGFSEFMILGYTYLNQQPRSFFGPMLLWPCGRLVLVASSVAAWAFLVLTSRWEERCGEGETGSH